MIGPLLAAGLMGWMRPEGLFLATAFAHLCLAGYTLLRIAAAHRCRSKTATPSRRNRPTARLPRKHCGSIREEKLKPTVEIGKLCLTNKA
jgi:hypothetical protein